MSRESRPQPIPSWPTVIGSATLAAAGASAQQAASWVAAQVSRGVIVACDPVQVRATATGSAAAGLAAIRADVRARKVAGTELAGNRDISMRPPARTALTAGRVDSRLLITLGALTHRFRVRIVSISNAGLAFLRAQRPPLLPLVSLRHHGKTTEVQIKFSAPSPAGLLGAGKSP